MNRTVWVIPGTGGKMNRLKENKNNGILEAKQGVIS